MMPKCRIAEAEVNPYASYTHITKTRNTTNATEIPILFLPKKNKTKQNVKRQFDMFLFFFQISVAIRVRFSYLQLPHPR